MIYSTFTFFGFFSVSGFELLVLEWSYGLQYSYISRYQSLFIRC